MTASSGSALSSRAFVLRLHPGEDLKVSIERFVREHELRAVCLATCVGSVRKAVLRFAGRDDADVVDGPLEIVSLGGTVSPDGAHLHISVADGNGRTTGGHLFEGALIHTTAEIVLLELAGLRFSRQDDAGTGFRELVIEDFKAE